MSSAVLHRYHILPRHAGGTDDATNIILLSIEDHAEAHHQRWLLLGQWQDKIAWQMLSGAISSYEANRLASSIANSRPRGPHSEETKRRMRLAHIGRKYPPSKKKGIPLSEETKQKLSLANKGRTSWLGRKHSPEAKLKMSLAKKALIETGDWKPWHGAHSAETKLKMSRSARNRKSVSGAPALSPTSGLRRHAVAEAAFLV